MSQSFLNSSQTQSQQSLSSSFVSIHQKAPIAFPFRHEQNLSFQNNQDYVFKLEATEEALHIQVEDRFDVNMWRGDYTSKYIEEICKKTGKERNYSTFLHLLVTSLENKKGSSKAYIDLLAFEDLQLLKARKQGEEGSSTQNSQLQKNNKKYLILTSVLPEGKVHYPLPLNPMDTSLIQMDKDTMKNMVKRMSQTLSEFKTFHQTNSNFSAQNAFNSQSSGFGGNFNILGHQTAKEFFSRENMTHPVVDENMKLKKKLQMLKEAKQRGGAVGLNDLVQEKKKQDWEYSQYKQQIEKEIQKLRRQRQELSGQIVDVQSELTSERPQSAYSQGTPNIQNMTINSNFTGATEIEELRRQLAESSFELEELKEQQKKKLALQQKDIEEQYSQLQIYKQDEKQLRVRVNQLENEIETNFKRLDIICKSKGLPRPKRTGQTPQRSYGGTYVSPYRQNSNNNSAERRNPRLNLSNSAKRPSPLRYGQYTPPGRRPGQYSPGNLSNASKGSGTQQRKPLYSGTNVNRNRSPGVRSNASGGSNQKAGAQNRIYSPSGRVRYGISPGSGVNRVRREAAVSGSQNANSRSNSRQKERGGYSPSNSSNQVSSYKKPSVYQGTRTYGASQNNRSSLRNPLNQKNTQNQYNQKQQTLNSNASKQTIPQKPQQKTTVLSQQKALTQIGTIDEKIEKLQNLLQMAKQPNDNAN